MKRTPLKRSQKPMKRSPLKVKRRGEYQWRKARKEVLERCGGRCEARLTVCQGSAEHVHHIKRRSQGGTHDPANLMGLCFRCHEWIHRNPAESVKKGLLGGG